jgi:RNA polymerase sigma-70 factor (ECF subfamily)
MTDAEVAQAYRDYAGAVYARAARILRDREIARDVVQEVFVRCFGHRPKLRAGRDVLIWLYRVTTNLCLNALRDGKLRVRADRDAARLSPTTAAPDGPARRAVWDLLAGLAERTQAIVIYVYLDGMTHAEAAEVARVTDRTVRNCLTRFQEHARAQLGSDLEPIFERQLS